MTSRLHPIKGQGALTNTSGRYNKLQKVEFDDGWNNHRQCNASDFSETDRVSSSDLTGTVSSAHGESASIPVQWQPDASRSIISSNTSPDVPFNRSINPYRGCEHGCIYCFARPTHTWLGHSAGVDFERLLYAKPDAAELLKAELARRAYQCEPIAVGVNTDAYQPLERSLRITRSLLKVFRDCRHPVYLITKSSLIERDLDILRDLAEDNLVSVTITITTLDNKLSSKLEPRATAPHRRLKTLERLSQAGIQTRASISPIIPALNETEIESLVQAVADAGAGEAHCILLRLPHELKTLFPEWLRAHYPLKADRILKAIESMRDGKLNQSDFKTRMTGVGPRAQIIQQRFRQACRRAGLEHRRGVGTLNCTLFRQPEEGGQLTLNISV